MVFCEQCGKEISNNSKFCKFCGHKLINSKKEKQKETKFPPLMNIVFFLFAASFLFIIAWTANDPFIWIISIIAFIFQIGKLLIDY